MALAMCTSFKMQMYLEMGCGAQLFIYSLTGFSLILDKRKRKNQLFSPKHVKILQKSKGNSDLMEGEERPAFLRKSRQKLKRKT